MHQPRLFSTALVAVHEAPGPQKGFLRSVFSLPHIQQREIAHPEHSVSIAGNPLFQTPLTPVSLHDAHPLSIS